MGLRSIWRHEDGHPPTTRQKLNRDAISALFWVILTALLGIIILSALGLVLRFGLFGADASDTTQSFADEALSILGNIGSAAIGGLVGWLTRDQLDQRDAGGWQELPPEPTPEEVAMPLPIEADDELDEFPPPDVIEEDVNEVADPDFVWPDEPDGDEDADLDDEEARS